MQRADRGHHRRHPGAYLEGWKLGLKALAIYRDGSKGSQPVSTKAESNDGAGVQDTAAAGAAVGRASWVGRRRAAAGARESRRLRRRPINPAASGCRIPAAA